MAMTLSELQEEVRENVKRDTNALSNARITNWLNWAQDYLADLHTYEEMRDKYTGATVAEQSQYGFPTRMKDIYSMTLQNGASSNKLIYVKASDFDKKIPYPLISSYQQSQYYVDYGKNFELYPIPDTVYSLILRASVFPSSFSSSVTTATSDLLRKDALLVAMATTFGFWSLREIEDAAYWGKELVPVLYAASLESDHSAEDWFPVARGFSSNAEQVPITGEWWKSPFTGRHI